jgi:hypothetical protein
MIHTHEYPVLGTWYLDMEHTEEFEIVAAEKDSIEIQYFSGEIEELDMDTWFSMRVVSIAAPQDWSGPYEIEKETFSDLEKEIKHPHPEIDLDSF